MAAPRIDFGLQFFPDMGPDEKSAASYWSEALYLTSLADEFGYGHVRTVEHYFSRYGGYSTNPIVFLSAASQRTRRARLVTGAILPVFNNPLKVAGEIGMLDAISGGRMDVGFARAFLPHEFRTLKRSLDESRARFDEGVEQVRRLLEEENLTMEGAFHSFENVTSLPRPTQKPRPPFWMASTSSPQSFVNAGRHGYNIMTIPRSAPQLKELFDLYRDSWRAAGHPGNGTIMMTVQMFCAPNSADAVATYREPVNRHQQYLLEAASDWGTGTTSKDYPNHPKMLEGLRKADFDNLRSQNMVWAGSPAEIRDMISALHEAVGGFEVASLLGNSWTLPAEIAEPSLRLFSEEVLPYFSGTA
jgi:alkanesulfonate monooxygenase SsuD/methylene tetrahydromethanopterin reductase-like flavin-dependent oxidoreductase (luciferase family)